ncbi:recombinase family protein [Escherichia coli]|nr:recombinase family protein [Escherichia coli]HBC7179762.1 recombinase family protein [Escherichia coli]
MLIGYVRVSTNDQNTDLQRNALNCAGCELIFEDKISGTKSERPGLKKLLRTLSAGDTLVVWKLDRLGRNMRHLVVLVDEDLEHELINGGLSHYCGWYPHRTGQDIVVHHVHSEAELRCLALC